MGSSELVESRMGAVVWAIRQRSVSHPRSSNRTCPIKASGSPVGFTEGHTGSEPTTRGVCAVGNSPSVPRHSSLGRRLSLMVFSGSSPITTTSPSSKAHQKSGPFAPPALPGITAPTTLSDSRHDRRLRDVEAATLARDGSPPITRTTFSDVPCPLPRRIERVRVSIASPLVQPLPNGRRVGIRIVTFEACSGFTHVTARRIAQPPKATFVTRLQPFRLPGRAARQLPDQSTTLRVESSSTGDPRLRGALPIPDSCTAANDVRRIAVILLDLHSISSVSDRVRATLVQTCTQLH